jgi:hypothetical protein
VDLSLPKAGVKKFVERGGGVVIVNVIYGVNGHTGRMDT